MLNSAIDAAQRAQAAAAQAAARAAEAAAKAAAQAAAKAAEAAQKQPAAPAAQPANDTAARADAAPSADMGPRADMAMGIPKGAPVAAGVMQAGTVHAAFGPRTNFINPLTLGRFVDPMSTDREKQLDGEIRASLANKPAETAAYDRLLESDTFKKPGFQPYLSDDPGKATQARVALLEQVRNYPEAGVIDNLNRLGGRDWFKDQGFEDQQRSAKVIGFNSSATTPNANQTRRNTVDMVLSDKDLQLKWGDLKTPDKNDGSVTYGQAGDRGVLWWKHPEITLNRSLIDAGEGKIDPADTDALHVAANTLAHEVNHVRTPGGNEKSYGYFMDEYRAWYVGHQAENGKPPTASEAYERMQYLTSSTSGGYGNIGKALEDEGEPDAANIRAMMAEAMGLDPRTATLADVRDAGKFNNWNGTAPVPRSARDDDPNNLDNHG